MTDWENLHHFAALAQAGSLSGAARLLNVEHATIARRVAALETGLRLKLVDRRGRRLALTADGERIAALVERIGQDVRAIERAAEGARAELAGEVTISAPPALAAAMLARPLVALRGRHPGVRIRVLGETRRAALDRREADIAIRLTRPENGDLLIVKLTELSFRLYGSSAYLSQTRPEERVCIGCAGGLDGAPQQAALSESMAGRPPGLRASTLAIQQALAREGGGVAMLPDFMAQHDLALVAVPGQAPVAREVWLVMHADMRGSAAIRAVADAIRESFASAAR